MESLIILVAITATIMYFLERDKRVKAEAHTSALLKRRDLDKMDANMEPLKDYVINPVPEHMYEYVSSDPRVTSADLGGGSPSSEAGVKKSH